MARIDDGFATLFEFAEDSNVQMWEKEVTPPGMSGGGAIDTTTMRNTAWRTMSPKSLKTMTEASATMAYDPAVYNEIIAMINVVQQITVTFADGSTVVFWGWLDEFTPNSVVEGDQPTAAVKVIPGNQNAAGAERAPVYTAP